LIDKSFQSIILNISPLQKHASERVLGKTKTSKETNSNELDTYMTGWYMLSADKIKQHSSKTINYTFWCYPPYNQNQKHDAIIIIGLVHLQKAG